MARLSARFAIFVVCCSSTLVIGAPDGAKENDLIGLDLQVQSFKVVLTGTNIVESLDQMGKLGQEGPHPSTIGIQNQAKITCPVCPAEVTTISSPEPVTCPACPEPTPCSDALASLPVDCYEYRKRGFKESGIYKVHPLNYSIDVYCDMEADGGGWTVFQRRGDFGEQDFHLNWTDFKKGFGDLKREFWLGNDHLFALTNQKRVSLWIDIEDEEGKKSYATYEDFLVRSEEDKYKVTLGKYAGNAGDRWTYYNNTPFTTKDTDDDEWSIWACLEDWRAGWWSSTCGGGNLNGLYPGGPLKRTEMKIRPLPA